MRKQIPPFLLGETEYDKSLAYNQWCRELPVVSGLNTFITDMSGDYFPPDGIPLKKAIFTPNGTDNYMLTGISCRSIKRIRLFEKFVNTATKNHGCRDSTWVDPVETFYYFTIGTNVANNFLYIKHGTAPSIQPMNGLLISDAWYMYDVQINGVNSITVDIYDVNNVRISQTTFAYDPATLPDKPFSFMAMRNIRPRFSYDIHQDFTARPLQWTEITDTSDVVHRWEFDAGVGAYIRKVVTQDLYYKIEGTVTTAWTTDNSFTNAINATGYSVAGGLEKLVHYSVSLGTSSLQAAPTGMIAPIGYGETIKSTLKSGTDAPGTKLDATYQGRTQYPLLLSEDKASFSFPDCNEMFQMFKNFAGGYFFDSDRVPNVVTFASLDKVQDDQRSIYNDNAVFITAFDPERSPITSPTLSTVNRDFSNITPSANYITAIYKADTYLYLRQAFDATRDLIQKLDPFSVSVIGDNKPMNYMGTFLIPNTNDNADGLMTSAVTIHSNLDDACPSMYNTTHMGGNHGCSQMVVLTSNNHGKDVSDIGSSWIDAASKTFYLIRVVDINTLWFLSANTATDGTWNHTVTITTGLTHVANAQNTDAIAITSQTTGQMEPAFKNQSKLVYLNGVTPLISEGVYACNHLEIRETYDICDPDDCVAEIVAGIPVGGYTVQPALNQGQTEISISNLFHFDRYGLRVKTKHTITKYVKNDSYLSAIQSQQLYKGAYTHQYYYIPDTVSISDTTPKAWDFASIVEFDTYPSSTLAFVAAVWADANYVPSRFIQFLGTSAQETDVGYALGYHMNKGNSSYLNRLANTTSAIQLSTTGKIYPRFLDPKYGSYIGLVSFETDTYRLYFPPKQHSANATCSYMYDAGDGLYLYFDYHQFISDDILNIGIEYNGKTITVIKSHASTVVITTTVTDGTIVVSSFDTIGWAILKLT